MGGIYGEAEAGCMGSKGAYIAALELSPQKLSIAGKSMVFDEPAETEKTPQKAYLINNEIIIEKFWLK